MRFFFLPHLFRVFFDFPRVHPIALFHPSLGIWIGRRRRVLFRLLFHHHVCVCVCLIIDLLLSFPSFEKAFLVKSVVQSKNFAIRKVVKKRQKCTKYLFVSSSWRVIFHRTNFTRWIHTRARIHHTKRASSSLERLYRFGKVSLRSLRRREGAFYVRVIRRKSLQFFRRHYS